MVDDHRHHRKAIHLSLSLSEWFTSPYFTRGIAPKKNQEKKVNKNEDAGAPG